jgi:hypothetical protein
MMLCRVKRSRRRSDDGDVHSTAVEYRQKDRQSLTAMLSFEVQVCATLIYRTVRTILYDTVPYCPVSYCTYNTTLDHTVLFSTVLYYTILYNAILYSATSCNAI